MSDQDLGGEGLKYVSYSILFTKRDYEAVLAEESQTLVNYSTNAGSYGGLKIAEFITKVVQGGIPRPSIWKDKDYPPDTVDECHWTIPEEDKKYITFEYHVERRLPRQESEYDKEQVEVLRKLSKKL